MRGICGGIGFGLILFYAACADGLMDTYGIKATIIVSLAVLAVSFVLIEISNSSGRKNDDNG